jgi:PII-like signaling protein
MKLPDNGLLLRIYVGEQDRFEGNLLFEEIVLKARELNLAGATVLRGVMGYGASSRIHSAKLLVLSDDLPVVIEIVDTEEKINLILPFLDEAVTEGLITLEEVKIITYRHRSEKGKP